MALRMITVLAGSSTYMDLQSLMKKSENLVTLLVIADCLYGAVQTGSLLEQGLVIRDGSTTGGGK
jgi:hypothetical protein